MARMRGIGARSWRQNAPLLITIAVLGLAALLYMWRAQPPQSAQEAAEHLDRHVIAFQTWDGTPLVVVDNGDHYLFDRMVLGEFPLSWPPDHLWKLDEPARRLARTDAPAMAEWSRVEETWMLFGAIRDPEITTIAWLIDGEWSSAPVASPGFIIPLEGADTFPERVRWLDAGGAVMWEQALTNPFLRYQPTNV